MEENNKLRSSLDAYLNGYAKDEDIERLSGWLAKEPANRNRFLQLCRRFESKDNKIEKKLHELHSKLGLPEHRYNHRLPEIGYRRAVVRTLSAAALFAMGILSGVLIYRLSHNVDRQQYTEVFTPRGEKTKVRLPDSTIVYLNSESSLKFLADNFHKERQVDLTGEAYFEIAQDSRKPFDVNTRDYTVRATGTAFNVMAYADFKRTETTLVSGKVNILYRDKTIPLEPNTKFILRGNTISVEEAEVFSETCWKDNKFNFNKIPFTELIRRLERWYNVDIAINEPGAFADQYYSGTFRHEETIWQVLDVIRMTTPFDYETIGFREISITAKPNNN